MASIEFGMMDPAPRPGMAYDEYRPDRYHCITVHDEALDPILPQLEALPCFWHSLDRPARGLAYCGITLIPPGSLPQMIAVTNGVPALMPLTELLQQAELEGKFIIHFGL